MTKTTTWKEAERRIARLLHGRRVGNQGSATEDVAHDWLSVEVKHRRTLPAWLTAALSQAQRNAPDSRLPVVILHQHGTRSSNDVVCVKLGNWLDWFGDDPLAAATPEELAVMAPDWEDTEEHSTLNDYRTDGTDELELLAEYNASYRELTGE